MAKNLTEMVLAYDMDRRLTFANAAAETSDRLLRRGTGAPAVHLLGASRKTAIACSTIGTRFFRRGPFTRRSTGWLPKTGG